MPERFERPVKIICALMALVLAWQLADLVFRGDPLAHLKIPALPALSQETNAIAKKDGTNSASPTIATNSPKGTNTIAKSTNSATANELAMTNSNSGPKHGDSPHQPQPVVPPGMPPEMMAQMMMGGMPGGPGGPGGGAKKIELPPELRSRVDKIIDSEIFGPVVHPVPMTLIGIAGDQAFIQATNGQIGPVKIGGEMAGVKLLRIGMNRVLVEQGGDKKELTLFGGLGGESLMPAAPTNVATTNTPPTNAPVRKMSHSGTTTNAMASHNLSSE